MRTALCLFLSLISAHTPITAQAKEFVITYKMSVEMSGAFGEQTTYSDLSLTLKGHMLRVDTAVKRENVPTMTTTFIYNSQEVTFILLNHINKTYSESDREQLKRQAEMLRAGPGKPRGARPTLVKTGESKKIGDYEAKKYTARVPNAQLTYWFSETQTLADALQALVMANSLPINAVASAAFPDPATFPGLPVRMVMEMSTQGMSTALVMDLVKVETREVDVAEFSVPPGYSKIGN